MTQLFTNALTHHLLPLLQDLERRRPEIFEIGVFHLRWRRRIWRRSRRSPSIRPTRSMGHQTASPTTRRKWPWRRRRFLLQRLPRLVRVPRLRARVRLPRTGCYHPQRLYLRFPVGLSRRTLQVGQRGVFAVGQWVVITIPCIVVDLFCVYRSLSAKL